MYSTVAKPVVKHQILQNLNEKKNHDPFKINADIWKGKMYHQIDINTQYKYCGYQEFLKI